MISLSRAPAVLEMTDRIKVCYCGTCCRVKPVSEFNMDHSLKTQGYRFQCKQSEVMTRNGKVLWLSADHDYRRCSFPGRSCGKCVRKLLCMTCNRTLGGIERVGSITPFAGYLLECAVC